MASSVTTLKLPKNKENLRPLIAADKELSSLFRGEMLRKIGLQQHLREMYKPITEETKAIASKIEEGTTKSSEIATKIEEGTRQASNFEERKSELLKQINEQPKLGEILTLLQNYPEVINYLRDIDYNLAERDNRIIELINKLPDDQQQVLRDYFILRKEPTSPSRRIVPTGASDLYRQLIDANGNISRTTSILTDASDQDIQKLKEEVANDKTVNLYQHNVWSAVNRVIKSFIRDVKIIRKSKKGQGIQFLPSGTRELKNKLVLALGSYKAGNTNTFNEISAIMDEMRRRGEMSIKDIKGIFKSMKTK